MVKRFGEWVSITPDAKKGAGAIKNVVSSDFKDVRIKLKAEKAKGNTRITYKLGGFWKNKFSFKGVEYDTLKVPDAGRMQKQGCPEIPQEGLFIAIPENAKVKGVKIISKKEKSIGGKYYVLPASKPVSEKPESKPTHTPNKRIYNSNNMFPNDYIKLLGTKHVAGRKVAHVMIYPLQYKPKAKKLKALKSIILEVSYETKQGMDAKTKKGLLYKSPLDPLILDSESIIEGERLREKVEQKSAPARTVKSNPGLCDSGNKGRYLIITSDNLKSSVSDLAESKRRWSSVKVVTVGEIYAEISGSSSADKIRNFLRCATGLDGSPGWDEPPEWVLLAGDTDIIPIHMENYETYTWLDLASDHYYSDLSGDLCPEIVISRIPVSTPTDMVRLCSRIISYEGISGTWRNEILLTAHEQWNFKACKEEIATNLRNNTGYGVTEHYPPPCDKTPVINTLNAGVIITNYRGYGYENKWVACNGLEANDVTNLNNNGKTPFVFSITSSTARVNWANECFGETWVRKEKAITFLGATGIAFQNPDDDFDKYLFDGIINQGLTKAGEIMNWAKTKLYLNYPDNSQYRDTLRIYLLLGDPTADFRHPADVYIRDNLADTGIEPSSGCVAFSPDILITQEPVADPQTEFGDMSKDYQKNKVEIGNTNYIYLRVCNRSFFATDVHAWVFWGPLTTALRAQPDLLIGETLIKDVPALGHKITTDEEKIIWPNAPSPGTVNHYCIATSVACRGEQHPGTAGTSTSEGYWEYIRNHNNVANQNVVMQDLLPDGGFSTKFRIQGFSNKTMCDIEIDTTALPSRSSTGIKIRKELFKAGTTNLVNMHKRPGKPDEKDYYWYYVTNRGIGKLKNLEIPAGNGYMSEIEVKLSNQAKDGEVYPLRISQKINGKVIGSITLLIHTIGIKQAKYIAVKSTHLIHKSSCPTVKELKHEDIITYNSLENARIDCFDWALDCLNEQFTSRDVSFYLAQKVLRFINNVKDAKELCKKVEDTLGIGYYKKRYGETQRKGIGLIRTTAEKIIKKRKELGKFTNLREVDAILGVGKDTFIDIVNSFK